MAFLSRFTSRFRVIIIAFWLVAAAALFYFSPKLSDVGVTDQSQFLPQDTQSSTARSLLEEKFTSTTPEPAGEAILVLYNVDGLSAADYQDAQSIHDWLISDSGPEDIDGVISIFENEALRPTLISTDQTAMVMKLNLSVGALSDAAKSVTEQIRGYVQENYPDSSIYFTGPTGLYQDMFKSVQQTIDRTTIVTIALVAILLLIIYRSPIAMLLPLIAIGCSYLVSSGLIGFLGQAGAKFSTLTSAYLVVIVFGVGTDYCLFIVSRYREELRQREHAEAQSHAITRIAPVIAASALTVIVAFLSLGISNFGMNQTTGYALAIGVAITLLAGLTLVPALMSLFGKHLFWPAKVKAPKNDEGFGWHVIGNWVSSHPVMTAVPIIIVLLVPYLALPGLRRSADMIHQLPQSSESVKGYKILSAHFEMGELSPSYTLVEDRQGDLTSSESLQAIGELAQSISSVDGVSRVTYYATPAAQLSTLAAQLRALGDLLGTGSGLDQLALLQTVGQSLQALPLQYPGITQSVSFQQAAGYTTQSSTIAGQISSAPPASIPVLLAQLRTAIYADSESLNGLVSEFRLETSTVFSSYLLASYFSTDKTIAKMEIILSGDPSSSTTLDAVARVRESLGQSIESSSLAGSSSYVGGDSAVRADIMLTNDADFSKVVALSLAGILIVIAILLRSVLAPLYMVATVLLNYGCTLGIATWIFLDVFKQDSIIYFIPLFIFVILVALGADYNIFLVSRIREEAQTRPIKEAVSHAVANTGGVITACGIILAGTFATLLTSPLQVVVQVGAAISIGIVVDTFLVRALLVPALAKIANRWSWWPSALFHKAVR